MTKFQAALCVQDVWLFESYSASSHGQAEHFDPFVPSEFGPSGTRGLCFSFVWWHEPARTPTKHLQTVEVIVDSWPVRCRCRRDVRMRDHLLRFPGLRRSLLHGRRGPELFKTDHSSGYYEESANIIYTTCTGPAALLQLLLPLLLLLQLRLQYTYTTYTYTYNNHYY